MVFYIDAEEPQWSHCYEGRAVGLDESYMACGIGDNSLQRDCYTVMFTDG